MPSESPSDLNPLAPGFARLRHAVLFGSGHLPPEIRQAAEKNEELPASLTAYVDKVHRHAYRIVDEDVDRLHAEGYSDDQVFELTVSAALGAAYERFDAGLRALRELRATRGGAESP